MPTNYLYNTIGGALTSGLSYSSSFLGTEEFTYMYFGFSEYISEIGL